MTTVLARLTQAWRIRRTPRGIAAVAVAALMLFGAAPARAQAPRGATVPALTAAVNDFAGVLDAGSAQQVEQTIRALQAASGDVIVVATVPTIEPYADIREYAVTMFQNRGNGVGDKGKDNGLLILLALKERRVWVEVGYGLEPFITDGFSGQVSRDLMTPEFKNGSYGAGLLAGTNALAQRVAQGRNVQLTGVRVPARRRPKPEGSANWVLIVFLVLLLLSRVVGGGPRGGIRRWGTGGMGGWSSGVGPFGGGFGGGGGGFGGGFGGFGGGRSGGGGGGSSW